MISRVAVSYLLKRCLQLKGFTTGLDKKTEKKRRQGLKNKVSYYFLLRILGFGTSEMGCDIVTLTGEGESLCMIDH